jgi:hypothetical protein
MSCPFYGKCAIVEIQVMVPQNGNQCALITERVSPCAMEMAGKNQHFVECGLYNSAKAKTVAQYVEHGDPKSKQDTIRLLRIAVRDLRAENELLKSELLNIQRDLKAGIDQGMKMLAAYTAAANERDALSKRVTELEVSTK